VDCDPLEFLDCGPEHLFQTLLHLQDQADGDPPDVARKAGDLYTRLLSSRSDVPWDLRTFFLGSFARLAAAALKHSAEQSAAVRWLELAERHFRAGVDPEPELARVMFVRLATFYTLDRLDLVMHLAPALDSTFARLGMEEDRIKGRILWSSSLKSAGRLDEAFEVLQPLRQQSSSLRRGLYGYVLRESGDLHLIRGEYEVGLAELREAASILKQENELVGLPAVVGMIGFGYRAQGLLKEALEFFVDSREGYARLGMKPYEAYTGLLVAETFLAMGRYKDAELLVLSVLPAIEEQGMVVNAIAAVNLLREAIRRQRLDPQVLRELRERLGGK
jgi:tetratricopeptide (TPR) repeat protein